MFIRLSAILAGLAVAAGAFGAHALKEHLTPDMLAIFETAARYQMYHALALLAVGVLDAALGPCRTRRAAGWCFVVGVLIFSGSLYGLSLSGIRWLGAITPIGGAAFLLGWVLLAASRAGTVRS